MVLEAFSILEKLGQVYIGFVSVSYNCMWLHDYL